jgi:hypothetical protein
MRSSILLHASPLESLPRSFSNPYLFSNLCLWASDSDSRSERVLRYLCCFLNICHA